MRPAVLALLVSACSGTQQAELPGAEIQPLDGTQDHVGATTCRQCHQTEWQQWQGSHHDLAMQEADSTSVLGNFDQARFEYAGTTSVFSRSDAGYFVTTDGPDGKLETFQIRYTFGHHPLQQYLIELPGGRLQAFGIAWDSRADAAGGQRWFHLYPDQALKAGDRLHWTGRDQNWNFMCADCHSTGLQKNYTADTDSYSSRWAEIDVSCEACHGPGLAHARWAQQTSPQARAKDTAKGLAVQYHERRNVTWSPVAETGNAVRSTPRTTRMEIDACGRCHGRANQLGDVVHGKPLLDSHRPALLDPDQYFPDGQMLAEVFNWGPFLQSKMQQAGVTCSDCHQPHSLQLKASGNDLCAQCHRPQRYDVEAHTHHATDSAGSRCVACHMPTTTFMQVDDRHDHAFRIPRPDQSLRLGAPNACNACHTEQNAEWAADQLLRWFPHSTRRQRSFGDVLHAAAMDTAGAGQELSQLLADPKQPAIVRASALRALAPRLNPAAISRAAEALQDTDPLVRMAAVETLAELPPMQRTALLADRLGDPVLAVRVEAASALAGTSEEHLSAPQREAFQMALREYTASLQFNADRPDTVVSLGDLQQRRGDAESAETTYQRALALDPGSIVAWLHRADLARARHAEDRASEILSSGLERVPDAAELHHALGLSLVRQRRVEEAESSLRRAAELAPETPRYAYVLAVALNDWGKSQQAREVATVALQQHPTDRDLLNALAIYELQAGNKPSARALTQRLLQVDPDNPSARQLLQWIER